jgi:hypothetical protein
MAALARSVVLPRLLDTLSATFQASSTRMDGLIGQMTQELEKVGVGQRQLSCAALAFESCCCCCTAYLSIPRQQYCLVWYLRRSARLVSPRLLSATPHAASCWPGSASTR